MKKWHWGILSTGNIAGKFTEALLQTEAAIVAAVGSRSKKTAQKFASQWSIPSVHGRYEDLASDPTVDIIYIATPHIFHYENMQMCLEAGKHVLCEKPITLNASQAKACIQLARDKNLFLMEAVWMRFIPAIIKAREMIQNGVLGDINYLSAEFMINVNFDAIHRLYNPALGGGALLDLGIYPLSLATYFLGTPASIKGDAIIGKTGIDETNILQLTFPNGAQARMASSMRAQRPSRATIIGTKGDMLIHDRFLHADQITTKLRGKPKETLKIPFNGNGYHHEIDAVHDCLNKGLNESPIMPLDDSLTMMHIMDDLRANWGISYPGE